MKIDNKINLVLPVGEYSAYHTPISREIFETCYSLLAGVRAGLIQKGNAFQISAGAQVAGLMLKDEGRKESLLRGDIDREGEPVENINVKSLLMDIKRLTTILVPTVNGFDYVPVDKCISDGKIDAEDWQEVESSIVFFTSHYWLTKKAERADAAEWIASVLSGSITPLSAMDYTSSLPK